MYATELLSGVALVVGLGLLSDGTELAAKASPVKTLEEQEVERAGSSVGSLDAVPAWGAEPGQEPEAGSERRHRLEIFLGNTQAKGKDEATLGLAYEFRLPASRVLGVGGLIDYAGGDLESTVLAGALFVHPVGGWRFLVAPGLENEGGKNEFLVRAGVSYEFAFGKFSVSPDFNVDFVDGEEIEIYGVNFGIGF